MLKYFWRNKETETSYLFTIEILRNLTIFSEELDQMDKKRTHQIQKGCIVFILKNKPLFV